MLPRCRHKHRRCGRYGCRLLRNTEDKRNRDRADQISKYRSGPKLRGDKARQNENTGPDHHVDDTQSQGTGADYANQSFVLLATRNGHALPLVTLIFGRHDTPFKGSTGDRAPCANSSRPPRQRYQARGCQGSGSLWDKCDPAPPANSRPHEAIRPGSGTPRALRSAV